MSDITIPPAALEAAQEAMAEHIAGHASKKVARAAQPSPQETNMSDTAKPRFEPCPICDNTGWVCEGHGNHPWRGVSNRPDSCDFGPGIPCPSSTCEHSLDRRDDDDNAALRAEVERFKVSLSDAVRQTQEQADDIIALRAEVNRLRAALLTPLTEDEGVWIERRAAELFWQWKRPSGPSVQVIMAQDGIEYWTVKATHEALQARAALDYRKMEGRT